VLEPYRIKGRTAAELARGCEKAIRDGALAPGERLPTVRALAASSGTSPATVAAAYRTLRDRGLVIAEGRRGTHVAPRPPLLGPPAIAATAALPPGVRDLRLGQPDRDLLPDLREALASTPARETLPARGLERKVERLLEIASDQFSRDRVDPSHLTVVGGALDGVEAVLQAHLARGDRVAVEDPTYPPFLDLLRLLGALPAPVAVDAEGMLPESLEAALATGVRAVIVTPRAQNPTGAATSASRATELRALLADRDVVIVEDDHAGPIAGPPLHSLTTAKTRRWAVIRSVSKSLNPDLRLAVAAGDAATIARVEGRQAIGRGWISTILQHAVAALWDDAPTVALLDRARAVYAERRTALADGLAAHGIVTAAPAGLNVWVPVREETATVEALMAAGWAAAPGERFRIRSAPGIRVTTAALPVELAADLAGAIAAASSFGSTAGAY
jgi:DNA-binding transcriptional MocR family regulator